MLDFFENSFYITDQYAGLRALEWEVDGEEKITATSCAYLTDEFMQSLVAKKEETVEEEDEFAADMGADFLDELGVN